MTKKKIIGDQPLKSSYQCHVCGDVARGLNFNVMTCMPCKTFFRKNAFKKSVSKICFLQKQQVHFNRM
jgi:ribosomal protein L37AE/L43A